MLSPRQRTMRWRKCINGNHSPFYLFIIYNNEIPCHGGAAVRRRTGDQKVAGSTPVRGAIKSTRSTQPSIPPG